MDVNEKSKWQLLDNSLANLSFISFCAILHISKN